MKNLLKWLSLPVLAGLVWLSLGDGDDSDYTASVLSEIADRKKFLKTSSESPFIQFDQPYREPVYFPVDSRYRVNAQVERIQKRELVTVGSSDGQSQTYQKFAWLNFSLLGEKQRLLVLKPYGLGQVDLFFLAISDLSSGESTYGGGRYLDIVIGKSNKVVLDFNLAYNPYCAYVDDYVCPFPPSENMLNIVVEAGEKYRSDY